MCHARRFRISFILSIALFCIVAVSVVPAQESRTYQYHGRLIDLEIDTGRIAVHFLAGADLEGVHVAAQAAGVRVARTEVIPSLDMAILTLDQKPGADGCTVLQHRLTGLPGVLCVAPIYASGTARCTTRDTVMACFSKDIPADMRRAIAFRAGARIVRAFPGLEGWILLRCLEPGAQDPFDVAAALLKDPGVQHAHPGFIHFVPKCAVPNDTHFSKQWALNMIDAPRGWDMHTGDAGIVIAVLDDGVDTQHEDLAAKIISPYDATDGDTNQEPNAWDGHGTACAGLAAAVTDNGKGVAGVSWKSKIMPIRIGYSQSASPGVMIVKDEWAAMGVLTAALKGADVVSNSWGGMTPTGIITSAIQHARTAGRGGKGCTLVFPTGNGDKQGVEYPATLTEVIAVGATDETDSRVTGGSWGSNYGAEIDVVAPGINLWTTDITGTTAGYNKGATYEPTGNYYNAFGGTSAAVPHVAGLAALILARNPGLSPDTVQDVIQRSADDLGPAGKDIYTGYGRINVDKALQEVRFIPVSGTIAQDTTWTTGHVYLVTDKVTVPSTVTLTIEADVVVKFKYQKGYLAVHGGKLEFESAPGKEVVFTSERDDTYGGDSNGDGKATSPAPGDWYCIFIRESTTTLHDVIFRYGDYTHDRGMVWIDSCSPTITACRYEHALMVGLYYDADGTKAFTISGSTFDACPRAIQFNYTNAPGVFSGNTIKGASATPVHLENGAMVNFVNNTVTGSKQTVIGVSGTITRNLTWPRISFGSVEMPYKIMDSLTVAANAILTIDPEVVIKFNDQYGSLKVSGDLILGSSPGKEVVFTSERDDTYGGDSNGDGDKTKPAPGDWPWVIFENSITKVHDAIFRYGGYGTSTPGMVIASNGCSPTFTDCRFEYPRTYGLFYNADPLVSFTLSGNTFSSCPNAISFVNTHPTSRFTGNTITGSTGYPVRLQNGAMVVFQNNTITGSVHTVIEVTGTVSRNITWQKILFGTTEMPYLVYGLLDIAAGTTLTVDPEVVVKLAYQKGYMTFHGDLKLLGSPGKEVVFTSDRDDTYGGDSNGDGASTKPAAGDWYYIQLFNSATKLEHAVIRYGGYNYNAMVIADCSPAVASCRFEFARNAGLHYLADPNTAFSVSGCTFDGCPVALRIEKSNPASLITGNTIRNSTGYPIELLDGAMVVFQNNTFSGTPNRVIKVAGEVAGNTTLSKISFGNTPVPYIVSGKLEVKSGGTLTIDAGVVVKYKYRSSEIDVFGKLVLNSSPGNEVVFTSERDDTHGGDSNGDGDLTKPAPNDWSSFYINGRTSPLHHVIFRYGGYGSGTSGMVEVDGSQDITSCRFEHATNYGVWYTGNDTIPSTISDNTFYTFNAGLVLKKAHPSTLVKGNTITGCTGYPIRLIDGATVDFQNNTITNSVHKVIAVSGSVVSKNITWKPISFGATVMPYLVDGQFNVKSESRLTIEAGVVVKFAYQKGFLSCNGDLELLGAPGKEVVFTSERDDEYGGDSNGDEFVTRPAPGDWQWIVLRKSTYDFHDAIVRYGGYKVSESRMVWVDGCSPDISSCRFEHALEAGLYYHADAKDPFVISNNTFYLCPTAMVLVNADTASVVKGNALKGTTGYPIQFLDGTLVSLQNNTFSNGYHKVIGVSGNIQKSQTWAPAFIGNTQVPYLVFGTLTVSTLTTLTIDPGVIVKFAYRNSILIINGDLDLDGAPGNPIVFTSERDDEYGGDSNGDGRLTIPAPGAWARITLYNSATVFENALLRYGGYENYGMLRVNGCSATVRNCRFEHATFRSLLYSPEPNKISFPKLENLQFVDSAGAGIIDAPSRLARIELRNFHVTTDTGDGLDLQNLGAQCILDGSTIRGRNNGITLTNAKPTIRNSIIHNCGIYGIQEKDIDSDPVLDHNCFHDSAGGQYYDHDTAAVLNSAALINALNPPASNTGNIVTDPLFAPGPKGNYYLSQIAAGQALDSPCVDHGNPVAVVHGTTRTDHRQDTGNPDLGYHYPLSLDVDVDILSVARQGQVKLFLAAGGKNAGAPYIIGCGFSGSTPGTELGGLHIPLNFDLVTLGVIPLYGSPMFVDFTGILDGNGTARPVFDTLGPIPGLKGLALTMVAVLPFTFASNPIDIKFQ